MIQTQIVAAGFREIPSLPVPLTEEAAIEIATLRLLSASSKLITLILDPNRRKPIKITRSDIVSFFDQVDASCRDQIHKLKQHQEAL